MIELVCIPKVTTVSQTERTDDDSYGEMGDWILLRESNEPDTDLLRNQSNYSDPETGSPVFCWLTFHQNHLRPLMICSILTFLVQLWKSDKRALAQDICGRLAETQLCSDDLQSSPRLGDFCSAALMASVFGNRDSILNAYVAIYVVATSTKQLHSNFIIIWPESFRCAGKPSSWKIQTTIFMTRSLVVVYEIFTYKTLHQYLEFNLGWTRAIRSIVATLACQTLGIILPAVAVSLPKMLPGNDLSRERLAQQIRRIMYSVQTVRAFAIPLYIVLIKGRFSDGNDLFWPRTDYTQETCGPDACYDELSCHLAVSLAVMALHRLPFLRSTCSGLDSFTASFLQLSYATIFAAAFPPAAVISYVMIGIEVGARKRSGYFLDIVPCDLDEWRDKFSSLSRVVVFVNTLVLAFGSEIVPMWFYAYRTGSLRGYTDFAWHRVDLEAGSVPTNATTCLVHAYGDLRERHKKFNDSHHVFLFRMGFAVIFQNVALIVTTFITQHA